MFQTSTFFTEFLKSVILKRMVTGQGMRTKDKVTRPIDDFVDNVQFQVTVWSVRPSQPHGKKAKVPTVLE